SEIEKRIDEDYRIGRLHAPRKTGIVTCSRPTRYGTTRAAATLLVMFTHTLWLYAPYLKNSDIAVAPEQIWRPDRVWVQYEGHPDAYLSFEVGSTWSNP